MLIMVYIFLHIKNVLKKEVLVVSASTIEKIRINNDELIIHCRSSIASQISAQGVKKATKLAVKYIIT